MYHEALWYIVMAMRTRTNLELDEDALAFASMYANAKGISLSVAVSELIRRVERMPSEPWEKSGRLRLDEQGILVVKAEGRRITSASVKEALEDLD